MDMQWKWMNWKAMKKMSRELETERLLRRIGLEQRSPTSDVFSGLGLFAVGVLVGAGLGLMFAPKKGEEIRQVMNDAWRNRGRRGQDFNRQVGVDTGLPPVNH
jgi:hypothetical protein